MLFHSPLSRPLGRAVDKAGQRSVLVFSLTSDAQLPVAGSFWILYNLERNLHFNRTYYYSS
jgi:hypothetical protein